MAQGFGEEVSGTTRVKPLSRMPIVVARILRIHHLDQQSWGLRKRAERQIAVHALKWSAAVVGN